MPIQNACFRILRPTWTRERSVAIPFWSARSRPALNSQPGVTPESLPQKKFPSRPSPRSGRDGPHGPPPGQNPASGFPAPGSRLGSTESEAIGWLRPLSDPLQECERTFLALCRACVSRSRSSPGRGPSLRRLDGRYPRLRRLLRYYAHVRLLDALSSGLRLAAFPRLLLGHHCRGSCVEISRFPCMRLSERAELIGLRRVCRRHAHSCRRCFLAFPIRRLDRLPRA